MGIMSSRRPSISRLTASRKAARTSRLPIIQRVLREFFLPSFEAAVTEAGILSVMASYNEIDGVPSHANKWLLEKVLRQEWGFEGNVVSDYYAIPQMQDLHRVAGNKADAARMALEA